jgi:hypothetical protein
VTRRAEATVTVGERWGDVARCRVEIRLEIRSEVHVRLEPGPLFAAVAATVTTGDAAVAAELRPCAESRRAHLYASCAGDSMLVLRRGPGRADVRVRAGAQATVVLEGYVLVEPPRIEPVRLYRTGGRILAVVHDWQGFRSLHFLSERERRERFGARAAEEVPFVAALESAATGRGDAAASDDTALAALVPWSRQPPFIGPARWIAYKLRPAPDPTDPEPPPPESGAALVAADGPQPPLVVPDRAVHGVVPPGFRGLVVDPDPPPPPPDDPAGP